MISYYFKFFGDHCCMINFYLKNRDQLKGQPKRTIGDYVEQNGILVPRRFDSLKEARDAKVKILLRSEHEQEYDGVSGLLQSVSLDNLSDTNNISEIRAILLNNYSTDIAVYCKLQKIKKEDFEKGVSFSLWENLGGYNRKVIADSAVAGRYHIMTVKINRSGRDANYTCIEPDGRKVSYGKKLSRSANNMEELVLLYEKVRSLDNFDPNHCPILEVQTVNGRNYFLQYHRTRDFSAAKFKLKRKPEASEQRAFFVRGITNEKGITCKVSVIYPDWVKFRSKILWVLPENEEASFDMYMFDCFTEIMVRKRKLQCVYLNNNISSFYFSLADGTHFQCSKLFKPELSIAIKNGKVITMKDIKYLQDEAVRTEKIQSIMLHVVSDGINAYVKRI